MNTTMTPSQQSKHTLGTLADQDARNLAEYYKRQTKPPGPAELIVATMKLELSDAYKYPAVRFVVSLAKALQRAQA